MGRAIDTASRFGRLLTAAFRRSGRSFLALALALAAATVPCAAADRPSEFGASAAPDRLDCALGLPPDSRPRVHGALSDRSIRNLRMGYVLALEMVRSSPTCSALFAPLAGSGAEKLAMTHYAATTGQDRTRICSGGVAAFTTVGGRVTWLCPEFANLHPRVAALTLIHEALHSAGMPERPAAAGALTAEEINDLVEAACVAAPAAWSAAEVVALRQ
jgi:hypothetical protein